MKQIKQPKIDGFMNPLELRILQMLYVSLDSRWNHKRSRSPFACLYIVEKGSGVLEHDGEVITMEPNHAYLIPSGMVFDYHCDHELVKLYLHMNMIGEDGFDILRYPDSIHCCTLTPKELQDLIAVHNSNSIVDALSFRHMIYDILSRILKTYPDDVMRQREYSAVVQNAMNYIQENLSYSLSLAEVSAKLYVADVTIRRHFKTEIGMTPRHYIEDLVFYQAEILLKMTNKSIKEISSNLGFRDQFYFSKRFSQRYHLPPQDYRKQAANGL